MAGFHVRSRLGAVAIALMMGAGVVMLPGVASAAAPAAKNPDPVGALAAQIEADAVCDASWILFNTELLFEYIPGQPFCVADPVGVESLP